MDDILLVTVDSLRADHVGFQGYDRETTPKLDELAASSHVLTNAFANGCGTSRSFPSILSSTYPRMYGGFHPLSDDRPLVSATLDDQGYTTGGFHSNPHLNAKFGYDRGFDRFFTSTEDSSLLGDLRQWFKDVTGESGLIFRLAKAAFDIGERTVGFNPGTPFVRADDLTDAALEWAKSVDGPRFLWVHYMDVHHPYAPPEEYQLEFRDDPVPTRRSVQLRRKMLEEPEEITDEELQTMKDLYDGEIRYFDDHAGRLIEEVTDAWGEDTVVAVTSDHGDEFREHGQFSHYDTFYDELIHVPLLVDAGDGAGEYDAVVELADVVPTLLDYAGAESAEEFVGDSLRPLFEDGKWEKTGVPVEAASGRAYRTSEWKYVRTDEDERLFDLQADPDERENVVGDHADIVERLSAELDRLDALERETDRTVDDVEMGEEIEERLEQLGYKH